MIYDTLYNYIHRYGCSYHSYTDTFQDLRILYVYIYICREREITNMSNIMCGPYTRVDACCLLLMMWTAVKEPGRCRDAPNNLIVFQGLAQLRRWAVEPKTYHKEGFNCRTFRMSPAKTQKLIGTRREEFLFK